jgi:PAS domain-containing protein
MITLKASITPMLDSDEKCTHLLWSARDITEHKLANEKLRESEERFSKVFNSSPSAVGIRAPQ